MAYRDNFTDGREKNILAIVEEDTNIKLESVRIIQVYNLFGDFTHNEINILKNELFCDPVFQEGALDFFYAKRLDYDFCVEVSYLPGVTDNVGRTSAKGIKYILKRTLHGGSNRKV